MFENASCHMPSSKLNEQASGFALELCSVIILCSEIPLIFCGVLQWKDMVCRNSLCVYLFILLSTILTILVSWTVTSAVLHSFMQNRIFVMFSFCYINIWSKVIKCVYNKLFVGIYVEEFLSWDGGDALAQAVQKGCGCAIPGSDKDRLTRAWSKWINGRCHCPWQDKMELHGTKWTLRSFATQIILWFIVCKKIRISEKIVLKDVDLRQTNPIAVVLNESLVVCCFREQTP